jgi:hypothetical protein
MSNVRIDDRNGSCGGHDDRDIVLEGPRETPWFSGDVRDLPIGREAQRLCRIPDWSCQDGEGPYQLLSSSNNKIIKAAVSTNRAYEYLLDVGLRPFDADIALYRAELWARRHGTAKPLHPIRESDPVVMWDVLCEVALGDPAVRCTCGKVVHS